MNIYKDMTLIAASAVLLTLITVIIAIIFGLVDSRSSITSGSWERTGYMIAGSFHISTSEDNFGSVNRSLLIERVEDGEGCSLSEPGFGSADGNGLSVSIGDDKCRQTQENSPLLSTGTSAAIVEVPLYSNQSGFYRIGISGYRILDMQDLDRTQNTGNIP